MNDDGLDTSPAPPASAGPSAIRTAAAPPSAVVSIMYWALPVLWMSTIFYKSSQNSSGVSTTTSWMGHLVEYGVLTLLLVLASAKTTAVDWKWLLVAVTLFAALYGVSDELHQSFVPGRTASVLDWMTDVFGALGVTLSLNERFFKRPPAARGVAETRS